MLFIALLLGTLITIAEPDLNVLAEQVSSVDKMTLILTVSIGVGIFLMLSILRNIFKFKLSILLLISYAIIFALVAFVPEGFVPLSFDSGSVTTGPISVPFIMAFGLGIASIQGSAKSEDESFGMIALSSAGPILAVMLIGIILQPSSVKAIEYASHDINNISDMLLQFVTLIPHYLKEVAIVLLPILGIFLIFQIFKLKMSFNNLWKILVGLIYAWIGISLFLCAVNFGFLPVGNSIGQMLATIDYNWVIVPLMAVLGFIIILAEPAVMVLTKQIETVTSGMIKGKVVKFAMCIGVALALAIIALRIMLNINLLWFIAPIYVLCFVLAFIVPPIFTGIAFDSGGVATGAMATTFVLPLIIGLVTAFGENIMLQGFGSLALIAGIPILSLLILGFVYKIMLTRANTYAPKRKRKVEIVEFDK